MSNNIKLYLGDSKEVLKKLEANSIDTVITDPPYGLSFMGKKWDYDVPSVELWKEVLRVLKPGGTALIFAGSRTQHRMACNVEDAGFILKDCIMWLYGTGFPKATDISKQLDKGKREIVGKIKCPGLAKTNVEQGAQGRNVYEFNKVSNNPVSEEAKLWNGWKCLSDDTQILTNDGWEGINEITKNHVVFSLDLQDEKIKLDNVKDVFVYDYNGTMISIKNRHTAQLITPNHKILCKRYNRPSINGKRILSYSNLQYIEAKDLDTSQYQIPTAGIYDGDYSIGEDFSELLGWIFAEGSYKKTSKGIIISQSSVNKNKVDRIRNLLNKLNLFFVEGVYNRTYESRLYQQHQFRLSAKDETVILIRQMYPNKKPTNKLWHLPLKEKQRMYESLMLGDGFRNKECEQFSQKDVKFLEWFQVFTSLMGYSCKINTTKFRATIKKGKRKDYVGLTMYNKTKVNYQGKVWCIETERGNFIAKRNGKIFITGNSHGLKPAYEPILVAMKPNEGSYAENALKYGVSGLNIDGGRIPLNNDKKTRGGCKRNKTPFFAEGNKQPWKEDNSLGRFPANIILDEEAGKLLDEQSGESKSTIAKNVSRQKRNSDGVFDDKNNGLQDGSTEIEGFNDKSGASRFFKTIPLDSRIAYIAKPSKAERNIGCEDMEEKQTTDGCIRSNQESARIYQANSAKRKNIHPTVKPLKLMEYLCILTKTPTGGIVLDPFMGSGTTGMAAKKTGRKFIGIELSEEYIKIAMNRIKGIE